MKKTVYSISAMMLFAMTFASCEKEPAFGTTLYPVDEGDYGTKVYIHELSYQNNTAEFVLSQTPVGLIVPEDEASFYVKTTKALPEDLTVTVEEVTSLSADILDIVSNTVVIPAGEMISSEPVRFTLKKGGVLENLDDAGKTGIRLVSTDGDAKPGINLNSFTVNVTKINSNFKGFDNEAIESLTQIPYADYTVDAYYPSRNQVVKNASQVSDSNSKTYLRSTGPWHMILNLKEEKAVKAFSFTAAISTPYSPERFDILTSDDGENWTSLQDSNITAQQPATVETFIPCVFYAPVKCKYVKFEMYTCYYAYAGMHYPTVGEVKIYTE